MKRKCEVWYQPNDTKDYQDSRIRLLKDGERPIWDDGYFYASCTEDNGICCWSREKESLRRQRFRMREYDRQWQLPKAIKVAEWWEDADET